MSETIEDLKDKISKGESFLASLDPGDPKRPAAERNLKSLRERLVRVEKEAPKSDVPQSFEAYQPPPIELDPRPDLTEDSKKWSELLRMASAEDAELCGVLNGIRCGGTRLKVGKSAAGQNRWTLQPGIDATGKTAWTEQREYEEARDTFLKPYFGAVTALLQRLADRFPPEDQPEQQELKI